MNTQINVGINKLLSESKEKITADINRKSKFKSHYIFLDLENSDIDIFDSKSTTASWQLNTRGLFSKNTVTTIGDIKNVVGMRVNRLNIPTNYAPGYYNVTKQQNILIEEFSTQSFITKNRNFHFYYMGLPGIPAYNSPAEARETVKEYKVSNNGYYWFQKPITHITTLTLSFGEGANVVPFPRADMYIPLNFTGISIGNPTTITTNGGHFLLDGDTVSMRDFTTNDPVGDSAVITTMNDSGGHIITKISANRFSIPVVSTGITLSTSLDRVMAICITKKITFGLELITLE